MSNIYNETDIDIYEIISYDLPLKVNQVRMFINSNNYPTFYILIRKGAKNNWKVMWLRSASDLPVHISSFKPSISHPVIIKNINNIGTIVRNLVLKNIKPE